MNSSQLLRLALVTFSLVVAGCDPAMVMVVRNQTKGPARLTVTTARSGQSDTTVTEVLASKGSGHQSKAMIWGGIGGWNDSAIAKIARRTKRLELSSLSDTVVFNNPAEVQNLFNRSRKRGFMHCQMVIDIH
jgi:hypothetical protein